MQRGMIPDTSCAAVWTLYRQQIILNVHIKIFCFHVNRIAARMAQVLLSVEVPCSCQKEHSLSAKLPRRFLLFAVLGWQSGERIHYSCRKRESCLFSKGRRNVESAFSCICLSLYVFQFENHLTSIYLPMALLQTFVALWSLFHFLNPLHSRWDYLDGGSARRKAAAYTENNIKTHNKRTQTSMPRVGF
jgi:hypothetical protein